MTLIKVNNRGQKDNLGRRNLMINGDMRIAQRGHTKTGLTGAGYHTVDRVHFAVNSAGTWTVSREADAPAGSGLVYSHKAQCTTADTSLSGAEYVLFQQRIEGQNLQHLEWNTSATKKVTLSFWFKTSKTGTYTCELLQPGSGTSVFNGQQITVSSANTWTKYELTYDGQPSSIGGAIPNSAGIGLYLLIWYAAGTTYSSGTFNSNTWHSTSANRAAGNTNGADSTSNNFYITGLQLEVGETASDFEHLTYSEQLSLCHRYYWTSYTDGAAAQNAGSTSDGNSNTLYWVKDGTNSYATFGTTTFPTRMRANPSANIYNATSGSVNSATRDGTNFTAQVYFSRSHTMAGGHGGVSVGNAQGIHYHMTADSEL